MIHTDLKSASCNSLRNTRPSAGIDWLEILFPSLFQTSDFVSQLRSHGQEIDVWNGKPGWYLSSKGSYRDLRLRIFSRTQRNLATRLVVNPNKYENYEHLCSVIDEFIPGGFLKEAALARIDFNVDLPSGFSTVKRNLDIKYKRGTRFFTSGIPTGMEFGKGEERVVIYDRGNKTNQEPDLLTRIEIRLKGRKLPFKKFTEIESIPDLLISGNLNPFKNVQLLDVEITKPNPFKNDVQAERYGEFQSLLGVYGYAQTKRMLSRNRNFHRNYGAFFQVHSSRWNLHQILTEELTGYFDIHGGQHE